MSRWTISKWSSRRMRRPSLTSNSNPTYCLDADRQATNRVTARSMMAATRGRPSRSLRSGRGVRIAQSDPNASNAPKAAKRRAAGAEIADRAR
jgi:hypothetical protein